MRRLAATVAALVVTGACSSAPENIGDIPELPPATAETLTEGIAASGKPAVVNVWASWCIPCRSEAPLLEAAADQFGDEIGFVGLNVRDTQEAARGFVAEFLAGAPIDHVTDPGGNVPVELGATRAVPITIFYTGDGEVSRIHTGVIDERTLALEIDELLARR